ncbi:MAG TPA: hypothetical protein VKZ53_12505 [Candidatus Angelobacter sp.]|nr:hypothetical protein [Candidatus Angelobacter sp.]
MIFGIDLRYATAAPHVRLFYLFLLVTSCFVAARSLALLRRLIVAHGGKKIISSDATRKENVNADSIANLAMAGKIRCGLAGEILIGNSQLNLEENSLLQLLCETEIKFLYLWEGCHIDVISIKSLALLTLLLSLLLVPYGGFQTFKQIFSERTISGQWALIQTTSVLFDRVALGMITCAIFYAIAIFFERLIMRRRAQWQYCYVSFVTKNSTEV